MIARAGKEVNMKNIRAIADRAERVAAIRTMHQNHAAVVTCYREHRDETPAETVAALVESIGYDAARVAVAEIVNAVGTWDARVGTVARNWAESVEDAADRDELKSMNVYAPSEIHPAHIDQLAEAMAAFTPAEETEEMTTEQAGDVIDTARAKIAFTRTRSAWNQGVKDYAAELMDSLTEAIEGGYMEPDDLTAPRMVEKAMLNGASDWRQYSWGGCSLIYDSQIACRLCTPSEFTRSKNGSRRPNKSEEWLDVQARALYQAAKMVNDAIFEAVEEVF